MKNQIAALFGIIVKFDGGQYLYDPKTGRYQELNL